MLMIKNLNSQILPLVVYQDRESKKTVAAREEVKTRKYPDKSTCLRSSDYAKGFESEKTVQGEGIVSE